MCNYSNRKYGNSNETLLHFYARFDNVNHTECTLLLEYGADINAKDNVGKSPLHVAVLCDHYEMVEWLLNNNAYVDPQNALTNTPLYDAVNGKFELCNLLLMCGADPNYINKFKETLLLRAAKFTDTNIVKMLLRYGANATDIDISGRNTECKLAYPQEIKYWCKQNKHYTTGSFFYPILLLLYNFIVLTFLKRKALFYFRDFFVLTFLKRKALFYFRDFFV